MRARSLVILLVFASLACGGEEVVKGNTPPTPPWENKAPALFAATPGAMSVGEKLTVLGKDFIQPDHGYPVLVFTGTYFDDLGQSYQVNLQKKATCDSNGTVECAKLTWSLFPNIIFHPQGDRLGYFLGSVAVINMGNDGSQKVSAHLPLRIQVKPSLIPRVIRPINKGCQPVVTSTLEEISMGFVVEAVGLRNGTEDEPLTFYWTFMSQYWEIGATYSTMDPGSTFPDNGPFMVEEKVKSGRTSAIADGENWWNRIYMVKIGADMLSSIFGTGRVKSIKTKKLPATASAGSAKTTVNVAAVDATGKTATLSIPITLNQMAVMTYNGGSEIAERYPPTQVSDCMHGGDIGRNVTYSEDKSESRSRSMNFNWNVSAGGSWAPFWKNPFALNINFNAGFGVDTGASLSTQKSKGLNISGQVLPGEYGVFYRQTTKIYKIGQLMGYNACGQAVDLGQVILTDWIWTPDLATKSSCPPPSNLPKPGKFL